MNSIISEITACVLNYEAATGLKPGRIFVSKGEMVRINDWYRYFLRHTISMLESKKYFRGVPIYQVDSDEPIISCGF